MSIFPLLKLVSAAIQIGVWINLAGLNNLGRPWFELGSAHEKFGDWTGAYCFLILLFLLILILTSYQPLDDTKKILNIISSISDERDMVSDQMGLYFSIK